MVAASPGGPVVSDGYHVEEVSDAGVRSVGFYGTDEPAAIASARFYAFLFRKRRQFRVALRFGHGSAVIYGR